MALCSPLLGFLNCQVIYILASLAPIVTDAFIIDPSQVEYVPFGLLFAS